MKTTKPSALLFTGDEFLRRNKIELFLNELIPPALRATNLSRFYSDDLDWSTILSQARTRSLMGGGVQVFWIAQADQIKKSDWSAFESYCAQPTTGSYFVFEADELSPSHPLVKLVRHFGTHFHFGSQSRDGGLETLHSKLKRFGKTLNPDAWQVLEERLGGSMRLMDMALDQLILYSESATIDEVAIQRLTKEFLRYEPFDLTEALAQKDIAEALKIFHFFYDASGDLTNMVGLIHWQLKRIWQAKRILARGGGSHEVSSMLRIPPFRLTSFLNQVKRFDVLRVEKLLRALWQIDWSLKTGTLDGAVAIEAFLAGVS